MCDESERLGHTRRDDEQALEEIRLLFARYRGMAPHEHVSEHDDMAPAHAEQPPRAPALAGR
jgi:hypothetical protein